MIESGSRGVLDTRIRGYDDLVWSGQLRHCEERATKQSIPPQAAKMDCFAEPVIRRRFASTGWLAMTMERPARMREAAPFSLRLLQRWMRAPEIRRGGILADLDDAAADGAGAGEMLEQRLAVAAADGAGEF
ncbi:hypothetical protein V1273_000990 [Bradyrhizobium sp. AZCC 1721]